VISDPEIGEAARLIEIAGCPKDAGCGAIAVDLSGDEEGGDITHA